MSSISWSLMAGMIGATMTATGMPASASWRMVSRRLLGVGARGSMRRASFASRVVIDTAALARLRSAIGPRMSMSRVIRPDFVTMPTGWLVRLSTSRMPRVMRNLRSIGW
jgi:hypothetical protein